MKGLIVRDGRLTLVDDLEPLTPIDGEVEVKVVCASVNPTDAELASGIYEDVLKQAGIAHLPRTGLEFSGIVTSRGERFEPGDHVFGYVGLEAGARTHQERITVKESYIARKPKGWSFVEAAAVPLGAQTSLIALRDVAAARDGERVLINGAGGGLGLYAVQIASRKLGLHVTAVDSPKKSELLTRLGAHAFVDYTTTNILKTGEAFDIVFDLTTRLQFDQAEKLLAEAGRFMPAEYQKAGVDFSPGSRSGERSVLLWVNEGHGDVLETVAGWVEDGSLEIFVDETYRFNDFEGAFARLGDRAKKGRVVMILSDEDAQEVPA